MSTSRYRTPEDFKRALEDRLRAHTSDGVPVARKRQLVVFDRFLARVEHSFGETIVLKGGLVLELRVHRARTTKDVDLAFDGAMEEELQGRLQEAGRLELGDHMTFEVALDRKHPRIENDGLRYGGQRFRAECRLAGKIFGQPFGVDVSARERVWGRAELIVADDTLAFAGIAPPRLRVCPVETHIAEKLHAYTLPRDRLNSRVKDLPDLALLAGVRELRAEDVAAALRMTFSARATHALPSRLEAPPEVWRAVYAAMARTDALPWPELDAVTQAVRAFLDPILRGDPVERWSARDWRWLPHGRSAQASAGRQLMG